MTADPLERKNSSGGAVPQMDAKKKSSTLLRWGKFNLVGAIGIGVQFVALFLLKDILGIELLLATAIAVETAVLHNFVWHERFTWADRIAPDPSEPDSVRRICGLNRPLLSRGFLRRLWRFHLANGAISILGNLLMMKALVGFGHLNYLMADAVAIALCALVNFVLGDQWVFQS